MVLLIRSGKLDKDKTSAAVRATFAKRGTHAVPAELDPPPAEWGSVFDALAKECGLLTFESFHDCCVATDSTVKFAPLPRTCRFSGSFPRKPINWT